MKNTAIITNRVRSLSDLVARMAWERDQARHASTLGPGWKRRVREKSDSFERLYQAELRFESEFPRICPYCLKGNHRSNATCPKLQDALSRGAGVNVAEINLEAV